MKNNYLNHFLKFTKEGSLKMREKMSLSVILVAISVVCIGCATVTSDPQPVSTLMDSNGHTTTTVDVKSDLDTRGFRYYLPKPYLLLSPDEKGNPISAKVILLPDYERAYYISSSTFLAKSTFGVSITNGLLQKVTANIDTTGVPQAALEAATEIAKARQAAEEASTSPVADLTARIKEIQALIDQYKALMGALPPNSDKAKDIQRSVDALELTKEELVLGTTTTLKPLNPANPASPKLFEVVATRNSLELIPVIDIAQ